jgi:rSAM/selenodomain-associated transferase 1
MASPAASEESGLECMTGRASPRFPLRNTVPPRRTSTPRSILRGTLPALAIFARAPIPRQAKTRLIPLLGPRGAADFHAALVSDVLQKVNALGSQVAPYLFLAGGRYPVSSSLSDYKLVRQCGADLGERLERAFRRLLKRHRRALVIGTDSPLLAGRGLLRALEKLRVADAVLGPCPDGGFYVIGLRRLVPGLFEGVRWGSASACRNMQERLLAHNYSCAMLEPVDDVDRPSDVARLNRELTANPAARRLAPSAWRFLQEFFVVEGEVKKRVRKKSGGQSSARAIQPPPKTSRSASGE